VRLVAALLAIAFSLSVFGKDVHSKDLPEEARQTLGLIKSNGPFPHPQDGAAFGNREKLLPQRARGYYREYTVKTPGARDRGARRIVAGNGGEFYYTEDHYRTFRKIRD
jgi:ribonuclease T1